MRRRTQTCIKEGGKFIIRKGYQFILTQSKASREILFDTFAVLVPDAEQHAAVSADHWAGVQDEGGAVQAEVEVGGDRHQQRALSAVQVLYGAVLYDLLKHNKIYHGPNKCQIGRNGVNQKDDDAIDSNISW